MLLALWQTGWLPVELWIDVKNWLDYLQTDVFNFCCILQRYSIITTLSMHLNWLYVHKAYVI